MVNAGLKIARDDGLQKATGRPMRAGVKPPNPDA
jgi:hypothetical protein